ncbi:hypothetical protein BDM02DRAFT_3133324, partial [Thelephora ganbajun]
DLVLYFDEDSINIEELTSMAEERALQDAIGRFVPEGILGLREHVARVEYRAEDELPQWDSTFGDEKDRSPCVLNITSRAGRRTDIQTYSCCGVTPHLGHGPFRLVVTGLPPVVHLFTSIAASTQGSTRRAEDNEFRFLMKLSDSTFGGRVATTMNQAEVKWK